MDRFLLTVADRERNRRCLAFVAARCSRFNEAVVARLEVIYPDLSAAIGDETGADDGACCVLQFENCARQEDCFVVGIDFRQHDGTTDEFVLGQHGQGDFLALHNREGDRCCIQTVVLRCFRFDETVGSGFQPAHGQFTGGIGRQAFLEHFPFGIFEAEFRSGQDTFSIVAVDFLQYDAARREFIGGGLDERLGLAFDDREGDRSIV